MANMDDTVDVELGSAVSENQLHFQDIPHSLTDEAIAKKDGLKLEGKTGGKNIQTHTFTNFPDPHDDDDDDEEDKSDLLKGEKKQASFWTFEYYQTFFDVDTRQVLMRIVGSMLPNPRGNFLDRQIRPNPDLYGPFWICTTLVFTTAIAGNLANYIQHGGNDYEWRYDFHKVTFAATTIYSYWWLIPTILWGIFWWRKNEAGYTFLEMICVYGYSLAIFIPISILWVVQFNWFQWLLVIIGTVLSGGVLVLTFWPALRDDNKKVAIVTITLIVVFHLLLAAGFELYFFHVPDATNTPPISPSATTPTVPQKVVNSTLKAAAKQITEKLGPAAGKMASTIASAATGNKPN